jgi:hypothetical protein
MKERRFASMLVPHLPNRPLPYSPDKKKRSDDETEYRGLTRRQM